MTFGVNQTSWSDQTKGWKFFCNVKTRWISLLEPLRNFFFEYRTLLAKMTLDSVDNVNAKVFFFSRIWSCLKFLTFGFFNVMFKVIVTLLVLLIYDDLYVLAPQYHYLGCFLLPFRHVLPLVIIWKHRLFDYICLEKRCLCVWSNICSGNLWRTILLILHKF